MTKRKLRNAFKNFTVALGVILVWRGLWYVFDWVDITFLGGNHFYTAIGGIILGLIILYLPDEDLKELGKL